MSNFAKNELLKYGWTEGKGLGKNENGIVDALKPKFKFDTTGIGHDGAEYNWWEHVYNKASGNLEVKFDSKKVKLNVKDKDAVEIVTSKSELTLRRMKKENNLHFGSFIKTSTLQDGKNVQDASYSREKFLPTETSQVVKFLTDEEILKACGGRTAHKGARHGLKLSGKLARIERQERQLLAKQNEPSTSSDWVTVEVKRKKKRKHEKMDLEVLIADSDETLTIRLDPEEESPPPTHLMAIHDLSDNSPKLKSKKSKLKDKRKLEDLTHKMLTSLDLSEDSGAPEEKKRKKKHKKCCKETEEPDSKRKKKLSHELEHGHHEHNDHNDYVPHPLVILGDFAAVVEDPGCNDDGFVSGDDLTEPPERLSSKATKRLNHKIQKKKKKKMERQQRKKLEKLSETLKTLDLTSTTDVTADKVKRKKKQSKSKS